MNGEKRRTDILVGVLLLVCAAALILKKLGFWWNINIFPLLISVLLVKLFWDGLVERNIGKVFFSLAFFIIVNNKLLHLQALSPGTVLAAALLGTIGVQLLFPHMGRRRFKSAYAEGNWKDGQEQPLEGREFLFYKNSFGGTVKYITGEIREVDLQNSFGGLEVFFSDAEPINGEAYVHVECSFGSVELDIPAGWKVVQKVSTAFAGIEECGACDPEGACVLYLEGRVSFGELEIRYI